ncbi:hypothetical protein BZG82_15655, partial [Salinivibrio sp. PR5]|uniref:alpha-amylase family glycosyl hydrolase n=1 Tax=Salinivibrio sp. PR5 TaxID=1909484 RepID=UPI00098AB92A
MRKRTLFFSVLLTTIGFNSLALSAPILNEHRTQGKESSFLDFRKETIYFVFLDRFSDGDSSNNIGENKDTYDPNDLKKYIGGDIRGLINKLPYLKSLGVTAIWITPPIDNANN